MQKQFHMQFKKLFKGAKTTLTNALNQKYKAITRIDDPTQILNEQQYLAKKNGTFYDSNQHINVENPEERKIDVTLSFFKGTKTIK